MINNDTITFIDRFSIFFHFALHCGSNIFILWPRILPLPTGDFNNKIDKKPAFSTRDKYRGQFFTNYNNNTGYYM